MMVRLLVNPAETRAAYRIWRKRRILVKRHVKTARNRTLPAYSGGHELAGILEALAINMHIFEIERSLDKAIIGIDEANLGFLIRTLDRWIPKNFLTLNGTERLSAGERRTLAVTRNLQYITFGFTSQSGVKRTLQIEPYVWRDGRRWLSTNSGNRRLRVIYGKNAFGLVGITKAQDLLGGPALDDINEDIDLVYTWVNHRDKDWYKLYKKWADLPILDRDSGSIARFHNKDELRYSLRSVNKFSSWVRKIYIVSNCSPPQWLDLSHTKIHWIKHEDLMPSEILPTFNSHVIESYIHHIAGLSEKFLYLNDDFYFCRPVSKEQFFTANGLTKSTFESYGSIYGEASESDLDYINASRNSARLIFDTFGKAPTRLHEHAPYALNRLILDEIENTFSETFSAMRGNRFRGHNDVNLLSFFYHAYAFAKGRAISSNLIAAMASSNLFLSLTAMDRVHGLDVLCINDGAGRKIAGWERLVANFHTSMYPEAAPWEKFM
jgi:hypothetical protein